MQLVSNNVAAWAINVSVTQIFLFCPFTKADAVRGQWCTYIDDRVNVIYPGNMGTGWEYGYYKTQIGIQIQGR